MRKLLIFLFLLTSILALPTSSAKAQVDPNLRQRLQNQGAIIVDHRHVNLIYQIPDEYITRARNIRMLFSDRSVGQNINESLDCLASASWELSTSGCRRDYYEITGSTWYWKTFTATDLQNGLVPSRIQFPADSTKYNRSNWQFDMAGDSWYGLTADYVNRLIPTFIGSNDIVTYQFSYLNVDGSSSTVDNVANPQCGFLAKNNRENCPSYLRDWHVGRIEQLETQYPSKAFFHWTSSLARGIGTDSSTVFNQQMRNYAIQNRKILFDVADILSRTHTGAPCYDNRDGVEYCTPAGNCENYPNDGVNHPAICQDYTTETNGGHLGSVSAGKIQVAKAYWVLMAQIAGWNPGSTATPPPTSTITPTPTRVYTPTPTVAAASPTPTLRPGDANGDGRVDGLDYVIWLNHYGITNATGPSQGDFNGDGRTDGLDYVIWLNNYGT
jgi:hypothetical protein